MTDFSIDHHPNQQVIDAAIAEQEADMDATWEAIHPYDRWAVDSYILNNAFALSDFDSGRHKDTGMSYEESSNLRKLFAERSSELKHASQKRDTFDYSMNDHGNYEMLALIRSEWMKRYFMGRVERVGSDYIEDVFEAKYRYSSESDDADTRQTYPDALVNYNVAARTFLALSDIELIPCYGAQAFVLIVPPGINVTGEFGHSKIIRWDDIDKKDGLYYALKANHEKEAAKSTAMLDAELKLRSIGALSIDH